MRVLMVEIPAGGVGDGGVPFGVLYAASAAQRAGHEVRILDLVKEQLSHAEVDAIISEYRPDVIGMGGITSGYRHCKELVADLRPLHPEIPIVVGGVISSVADLLLTRTGVDYIVHGEAEHTFPELLEVIETRGDVSKVLGVSRLVDGEVVFSGRRDQVMMDDVPPPDFTLLAPVERYLDSMQRWLDVYFVDPAERAEMEKRLEGHPSMLPIITARGCTHACIFCYRHQRGWRQHSVEYVVNMMAGLRDAYGVTVFQINDELTTANREWVLGFCDLLEGRDLGVFFILLSSRVDSVDEEMLTRLKQAGCLMINYGYESGSDTILKEIRKGVNREQALRAGAVTKHVGIKNCPEIMIGFPSETPETVADTIDFLKKIDEWPISVNTPIPFPQTPLWTRAIEAGLIGDEEAFVLEYRRHKFVNFTAYPDKTLQRWVDKVTYDTKASWLWNRGRYGASMKARFDEFLLLYVRPLLPASAHEPLKRMYRGLVGGAVS